MAERDKELGDLNRAIGARVQQAREAKNITRAQLATVVGLSDGSALYKYERGTRGFNPKQLGRIADALACTVEWLVKGAEFEEGKPPLQPRAALLQSRRIETLDEAAYALAPLGIRLQDSAPSQIPQPILDLINLGWANPVTNEDILHLRIHLATGGSALPHDLELAVRAHRLQLDGSDENLRALNEANRRRAEALGGKRLLESEIPPPPARRRRPASDTRVSKRSASSQRKPTSTDN